MPPDLESLKTQYSFLFSKDLASRYRDWWKWIDLYSWVHLYIWRRTPHSLPQRTYFVGFTLLSLQFYQHLLRQYKSARFSLILAWFEGSKPYHQNLQTCSNFGCKGNNTRKQLEWWKGTRRTQTCKAAHLYHKVFLSYLQTNSWFHSRKIYFTGSPKLKGHRSALTNSMLWWLLFPRQQSYQKVRAWLFFGNHVVKFNHFLYTDRVEL